MCMVSGRFAASAALGIGSTYSIINKLCASARVKGTVRQLGTTKERLFAKSRILHEFAQRLRVEKKSSDKYHYL